MEARQLPETPIRAWNRNRLPSSLFVEPSQGLEHLPGQAQVAGGKERAPKELAEPGDVGHESLARRRIDVRRERILGMSPEDAARRQASVRREHAEPVGSWTAVVISEGQERHAGVSCPEVSSGRWSAARLRQPADLEVPEVARSQRLERGRRATVLDHDDLEVVVRLIELSQRLQAAGEGVRPTVRRDDDGEPERHDARSVCRSGSGRPRVHRMVARARCQAARVFRCRSSCPISAARVTGVRNAAASRPKCLRWKTVVLRTLQAQRQYSEWIARAPSGWSCHITARGSHQI